MSTAGRTIVFFPEGAFGPTNNCVGIGDVLRRRGHRVVFIVEESFAGEGIRGIRIYRRPGHRFGELRRGADRAGAVLAVGESREQALERATRAEAMIRFETVDVQALV